MINQLLQMKSMLQLTPLFDDDYIKNTFVPKSEHSSVSAEVRYLNEKDLWSCGASGLFNGSYYAYGNTDLASLSYPPIIHYITNGYFEARRPSALVDIEYIVLQIVGEAAMPDDIGARHELKKTILKKYSGVFDLLSATGVNPNRLFDNQFYLETNNIDVSLLDERHKAVPLLHYYSNAGFNTATQAVLNTSPLFSMEKYLSLNQDIREASVNPLEHLLTLGLSEKRLQCLEGLLSKKFLENTADLYQDERFKDHEYFIAKSGANGQLAGPAWASKYRTERHPALCMDEAKYSGSQVTVGTVLYNNSKEELDRLSSSIKKEKECCDTIHINDVYFVNDIENIEVYAEYFGREKLFSSEKGNIGFGSAHNELMANNFDKTDYYFGINPDGYLIRDCIKALVSFSKSYQDSALVEANTIPVSHPKWYDPVLFDTKWVSGVAFFVPKKIWLDVGGFDDEIHMYCEDVDWSWRVRAAGYSLKTCPTANFFHDITPRFKQTLEDSEHKKRRRAMLLGAHYLSVKWRSDKQADKYYQMLVSENLTLPNQTIAIPSQLIPRSVAKEVADFRHDLRFSPSRFW